MWIWAGCNLRRGCATRISVHRESIVFAADRRRAPHRKLNCWLFGLIYRAVGVAYGAVMPRRRCSFLKSEAVRAIQAARAAGLKISAVKIDTNGGTITLD